LLVLIDDLTGAGFTIDLNGEATITDAAQISDIEFGESHGRQAITVTLANGSVFGPYRMNDVDVVDGTGAAVGELKDLADDRLPKAGWNWILAHNDGSDGIHNPTFVFDVLDASITELNRLAGE
jgi:hypothetical protein